MEPIYHGWTPDEPTPAERFEQLVNNCERHLQKQPGDAQVQTMILRAYDALTGDTWDDYLTAREIRRVENLDFDRIANLDETLESDYVRNCGAWK